MIPHNPPIRPAMGAFEYMGAQSRPLSLGRNPATNSDRRGSSLPGNNGMGRIAKFPTYRASFFANQLLRSGVIHSRPITEMGRPLPNPATLWERPARAGTAPPSGAPLCCVWGASPRMRGPPVRAHHSDAAGGIIPARAGTTSSQYLNVTEDPTQGRTIPHDPAMRPA